MLWGVFPFSGWIWKMQLVTVVTLHCAGLLPMLMQPHHYQNGWREMLVIAYSKIWNCPCLSVINLWLFAIVPRFPFNPQTIHACEERIKGASLGFWCIGSLWENRYGLTISGGSGWSTCWSACMAGKIHLSQTIIGITMGINTFPTNCKLFEVLIFIARCQLPSRQQNEQTPVAIFKCIFVTVRMYRLCLSCCHAWSSVLKLCMEFCLEITFILLKYVFQSMHTCASNSKASFQMMQ